MPSLGKDLAAIRIKEGLNIEDIHQSTKVPPKILRSIENDTILSQLDENPTYIRSYVRSYAKAVGIEEEDIVWALDQVELGTYDGSLTEEMDSNRDSSESIVGNGKNDAGNKQTPKFKFDEKASDWFSNKKQPDKSRAADDADSISSVDWVDVGRRVKSTPSRSHMWRRILIIAAIVVIVLAAIFLVYYFYDDSSTQESNLMEENAVFELGNPPDSLRESLISEDNTSLSNNNSASSNGTPSLGDTLSIAIYASSGNLEPVRVYTDILGTSNPYWVTEGDTLQLNFVNTFRLRTASQYDRLQLLFNGHIIQNYFQRFYNDSTGMVELDRSLFEDEPKWQIPVKNQRP